MHRLCPQFMYLALVRWTRRYGGGDKSLSSRTHGWRKMPHLGRCRLRLFVLGPNHPSMIVGSSMTRALIEFEIKQEASAFSKSSLALSGSPPGTNVSLGLRVTQVN